MRPALQPLQPSPSKQVQADQVGELQDVSFDMNLSLVLMIGLYLLGSLNLLLHGTQGEGEEGRDQHALHWDWLQGGHQEEPPLGQEADQDTQDSQAQNVMI